MAERSVDVAIIGGGPAGVSTAINLKRLGISPLLIERAEIGGLISEAFIIRNAPLFPEGITGMEVAERLRRAVKAYEVEVIRAEVTRVEPGHELTLHLPDGTIRAKHLVIATGTTPRRLEGLPALYSLRELMANMWPCEHVLVIGSGEVALDYALHLAHAGARVTLVTRRRLKANHQLIRELDALLASGKIRRVIAEVMSAKRMGSQVMVRLSDDNVEVVDAVLVAIGRVPALKGFEDVIDHPNVFLAGDVRSHPRGSLLGALSDGLQVALRIREVISR